MSTQIDPFYMDDRRAMQSLIVDMERARAHAARKEREDKAIPEWFLHNAGSAMSLALIEVYMMWSSRFGDEWVPDSLIKSEPFFKVAATRLHAAGQMECITVSGAQLYDVYRIRRPDGDR